jgi:hypothetical protein
MRRSLSLSHKLGGFAHVGFEFGDVGVEVGLGGEGETSVASFSSRST